MNLHAIEKKEVRIKIDSHLFLFPNLKFTAANVPA